MPAEALPRWVGSTPVAAGILGVCTVAAVMMVFSQHTGSGNSADDAEPGAADPAESPAAAPPATAFAFDAQRAFGYLESLCEIGPRPSGSEGMRRQQELIVAHFEKLGAEVRRQEFRATHPLTGKPVPMTNLVVTWHPKTKSRVLLAAHYDTRPFLDRDPVDPRGEFVGANDGASGVALLMELGPLMPKVQSRYGVDFVLFDGEELVFRKAEEEQGEYFLGSRHFSEDYRQRTGFPRYRWGVLVDMVGDADLQLYHEKNSFFWPDTKPLVRELWGIARRLGVKEFISRVNHEIRDDHLMLHDVGKIPTCDIIDFDYPHWHTRGDTPDKCSGESLKKVGHVLYEWLRAAP